MKKNLYIIIVMVLVVLLAIFMVSGAVGSESKDIGYIKGRVVDYNYMPVKGAKVYLKGTRYSTSTDHRGRFLLSVPSGSYTLSIEYSDYSFESEIEVEKGDTLNLRTIVLSSDEELLEEITPLVPGKTGGVRSARLYSPSYSSSTPSPAYGDMPYVEYNTEEYDRIYENPFLSVISNPLSTFSIDVDVASYANVRRFLNNGTLPPEDAVRIEELINYFNYDYPEPAGKHPFSITTEISDCPWNKGHKLILIGIQGKKIDFEKAPPVNLVFLIDVSGSMSTPNKLPLLKRAFRLLVNQLRPIDKVAIVVYAGSAGLVLPPTSGAEKEKILSALERLEAGGSTAGGEGIKLAYKIAEENFIRGGNNRVILATDGDFNVGITSDAELVRLIEKERKTGVYLTVLGFGMGNYKDSKMEKLADKGNGNYAYIDNILEARKVLVNEMGGTLFTIAKDVKIQVEFNPARVKAYRLIGYENRLLRAEDFNNDKKDAGELGAGHTVTALYEIIPADSKEEVPGIDSLRYQRVKIDPSAYRTNEIMTVKFRYKRPGEEKSILIVKNVIDKKVPLEKTSDNFRFAAAVAEFGLLLRDSDYKKDANYKQVIELAKGAMGEDREGYRAEFIKLVRMAEALSQ